jgi:hypothetical protein
MQVNRKDDGSYMLSHANAIDELLQRFDMSNCKPTDTPAATNFIESFVDSDVPFDNNLYRSAVGSLQYLALSTRPDIAVATRQVSHFLSNPGEKHWKAVKRILRYLKGSKNYGLLYSATNELDSKMGDIKLECYADADFASDLETRKSHTGFINFILNGCISWKTKRQKCIATSTAEAEYMAVYEASKEIKWIRLLLKELGFEQSGPTIIHEDNTSAISMSTNDGNHSRTKHIDIKYHYVKDLVKENIIQLKWISTNEQIADIFTKPLGKIKFTHFRNKFMTKIE